MPPLDSLVSTPDCIHANIGKGMVILQQKDVRQPNIMINNSANIYIYIYIYIYTL
jgi:hypothetical protein